MPLTQTDSDGQLEVWNRELSTWQPASELQTLAEETTPMDAFGAKLGAEVANLGNLANMVSGVVGQSPDVMGIMGRESQAIARRSELISPLDEAHPGPTWAGVGASIVADPLNLLLTGGSKAASKTATTLSERVVAGVEKGTQPSPLVQSLAESTPVGKGGSFLDDSAGAAAVDPTASGFLDVIPGARRIMDEFFDPQPISGAQRELLKTGDELGFSWLPGQQGGKNMLIAGVKSHPILAGAFDSVLSANKAGFDASWLKAIGSDAKEFSRGALGEAMESTGSQMDMLAQDIGQVALPSDLSAGIKSLAKIEPDLDDALKAYSGVGAETPLTGKELMGIRSLMNKMNEQLYRQGNAIRAERVDDIMEQIDDIIEAAVGPEKVARYGKLRTQWRNGKLLESPGVIGKDEVLSPSSIHNKLVGQGRAGSTTYRRSTSDLSKITDDATRDAYKWTKVSNAFGDNIGDSGTATRQYLQKLMSGDYKELGKSMLLKKIIEKEANKGLSTKGLQSLEELPAASGGI
jgi:hypothetical protein